MTVLYSSVHVITVFTKVVLNKIGAVYLGVEGLGMIGIFQAAFNFMKILFGLGINESTVREIPTSIAKKNFNIFNVIRSLSVTLGLISIISITYFSENLSYFSFGNSNYYLEFIILSFGVFFGILSDVNISILRGLQQHKLIAKSNVISSVMSLLCGVLLYIYLGLDGVIYSICLV